MTYNTIKTISRNEKDTPAKVTQTPSRPHPNSIMSRGTIFGWSQNTWAGISGTNRDTKWTSTHLLRNLWPKHLQQQRNDLKGEARNNSPASSNHQVKDSNSGCDVQCREIVHFRPHTCDQGVCTWHGAHSAGVQRRGWKGEK